VEESFSKEMVGLRALLNEAAMNSEQIKEIKDLRKSISRAIESYKKDKDMLAFTEVKRRYDTGIDSALPHMLKHLEIYLETKNWLDKILDVLSKNKKTLRTQGVREFLKILEVRRLLSDTEIGEESIADLWANIMKKEFGEKASGTNDSFNAYTKSWDDLRISEFLNSFRNEIVKDAESDFDIPEAGGAIAIARKNHETISAMSGKDNQKIHDKNVASGSKTAGIAPRIKSEKTPEVKKTTTKVERDDESSALPKIRKSDINKSGGIKMTKVAVILGIAQSNNRAKKMIRSKGCEANGKVMGANDRIKESHFDDAGNCSVKFGEENYVLVLVD
jgi:hypothetical protein